MSLKDYANKRSSLNGRSALRNSKATPSSRANSIIGYDGDTPIFSNGNSADDIKKFNDDALKAQKEFMDKNSKTNLNIVPDSRTIGNYMFENKAVITLNNSEMESIARVRDLWSINALPPMPDNVVDPPVMYKSDQIGESITSWQGNFPLVGRDYLQRVIARGQFLILVPLDIEPLFKTGGTANITTQEGLQVSSIMSNITDSVTNALKTVESRLSVTSYGLSAKVNSLKYNRACSALMKTALYGLGIDLGNNKYNSDALKEYLPDEIVDKIINMTETNTLLKELKSGQSSDGTSSTGADHGQGNATDYYEGSNKGENRVIGRVSYGNSPVVVQEGTINEIVKSNSIVNLLKYITNIDSSDSIIETMPFSIFYCNGPIERTFGASSSLGESSVAGLTTDARSKLIGGTAIGVLNSATNGSMDVEGFTKELAYHRSIKGVGGLVSNTYIPSVIKNAMLDFSFNVNIRDVAISSDRFSIARIFWTLCQLEPFVIQTNDPSSTLILPTSPMYCAAFSKGIMNLPRAAITSMSVKTNPEFQTTEGIPTEFDIQLTITPLMSVGTMPDFGKWYDYSADESRLIAAMYNPLSAFNIIATLCGQNTILTKFNEGFREFLIEGAAKNLWTNIMSTGHNISTTWTDWMARGDALRSTVKSTMRIL